MPFTFSHPAIALPLLYLPKKWFSLTGLVIGSMAPDFEYFLRMSIKSDYSHTLVGLFGFDLPLGILLAFIFHNIVRDSLFDNLPQFFKSRFSIFKRFNWNAYIKTHWFIVTMSVLIGAGSHLVWDSFTHEQGHFVMVLPVLENTIDILGNPIPIFKILQHTSSIIGAFVIAMAIYMHPVAHDITARANKTYWAIFTGIAFVIIAARFTCGLNIKQYGDLIVTGISAILIALILAPLLATKKKGRRATSCKQMR